MYLVGAGVHTLFGPGPDIAIATNAIFALVLLIATYGLGRHLFSPQVGILAAGLTLLMPRLLHNWAGLSARLCRYRPYGSKFLVFNRLARC